LGRIRDLREVICPPYDIISPDEQEALLAGSPHNVVRLELGERVDTDTDEDNRYTRTAALLKGWIDEGVLTREVTPALYITQHCFSLRGAEHRRWGLVAGVGIQDWSEGGILPHEAILKKPAADRLSLLRACRVNLSAVIGMLRCEGGELVSLLADLVQDREPLIVTEPGGIVNKLWVVQDQQGIAGVGALCRDKLLYILDGHHRYHTALTYSKELRDARPAALGGAASLVMMNLVDSGDPGLILLPTHRLVRVDKDGLKGLRDRFHDAFGLERIPRGDRTLASAVDNWRDVVRVGAEDSWRMGVYGLSGKDLDLIAVERTGSLMDRMPKDRSEAWKRLDVSLLHSEVLGGLLGGDGSEADQGDIEYARDAEEAVSLVDAGEFQLAFLLNPIPVASLMAVAEAGDRMPQKSTYLYPKPPTGLVMNPLWD
jgi:uncharacterized protein (DUF1015 family)